MPSISRRTFITMASALWPATLRAGVADLPREYQLKAAFVYNVMKFVTWPEAALGPAEAPVVIVVVGSAAAAEALAVLDGKMLRGRRIVVKPLTRVSDLQSCHVLFATAEGPSDASEALRAADGLAILTVTDMARAPSMPMIELMVADSRLTFAVNLDAAEVRGLQLSSNLLGLAASVHSTRLKRGGR